MVGIRIMLLSRIHKCRWIMSFAFFWKLAMNPRVARDNYFYGGFIKFYF